jgi:hypothetical protein
MNIKVDDIIKAKNNNEITEKEWREIYNILQKIQTKSLD